MVVFAVVYCFRNKISSSFQNQILYWAIECNEISEALMTQAPFEARAFRTRTIRTGRCMSPIIDPSIDSFIHSLNSYFVITYIHTYIDLVMSNATNLLGAQPKPEFCFGDPNQARDLVMDGSDRIGSDRVDRSIDGLTIGVGVTIFARSWLHIDIARMPTCDSRCVAFCLPFFSSSRTSVEPLSCVM